MASVNKSKPWQQAPLVHVNASERAKQFVRIFMQTAEFSFVNTVSTVWILKGWTLKDHFQSKKHVMNKTSKQTAAACASCATTDGEPPMKRQATLTSALQSKGL